VKIETRHLVIVFASMLFVVTAAVVLWAQGVPVGTIVGSWEVKFENGTAGTLVVDRNKATLDIPKVFQGEGGTGDRGDYVEFFMTGKGNVRLFVFGYVKGNMLEGKIQDNMPCEGLKKAFGSSVNVLKNSCQVPFKASRK
jgi:hypothetical protein